MDEKTFGEMIRERRKSLNWTQGRLGKEIHVSTDFISRIEKGERTPSERVKLDLDDFLAGKGKFAFLSRPSETIEMVGEKSVEYQSNYIQAVAKMMEGMDEDTQKDVFLSVQKEKLLRELLTERQKKRVGQD